MCLHLLFGFISMSPESAFKIQSDISIAGEIVKGDVYNSSRNKHRAKRIEAGLCRDCGGNWPLLEGRFVCSVCAIKRAKSDAKTKQRKKEAGLCLYCSKPHNLNKKFCSECTEKAVNSQRLRRKENKEFIYKHFGSKCLMCSESDIRVMSLDHVDKDGKLDRISDNGKKQLSPAWYAKLCVLIKAGKQLPRNLQMLCFNCHAKKDLTPWWFNES